MYNDKTGNLVLSGKAGKSAITTNEDSEKHILCTSYLDFGDLKII